MKKKETRGEEGDTPTKHALAHREEEGNTPWQKFTFVHVPGYLSFYLSIDLRIQGRASAMPGAPIACQRARSRAPTSEIQDEQFTTPASVASTDRLLHLPGRRRGKLFDFDERRLLDAAKRC